MSRPGTEPHEYTIRDIAWRTPHMLAWLWSHLLVEVISNQSLRSSIIEDAINKPWRPLPAGRLTVAEARNLTRVSVVVALALSSLLGNLLPSTTLMTLTWLYNDLDGSSAGPLMRNILNGAGLACFGWGAVGVLLPGAIGDRRVLRDWLLFIVALVSTTVHIQDLADREGDKARGRQTAAIVFGEDWTRSSIVVMVIVWSAVCSAYWRVPPPYALAPLGISLIMSAVILLGRSRSSSELGLRLWCLWVTVVFLLPLLSSNTK
ncbi:hypothetical protein NPX13_g10287 [Xylaria arbuscula]|uniref:UbiA prenyltransferase n=1 Tax=Xylaria arbuscula TaxID=114810 RepID=A0A9W8N4U8_9PEZI|nr:hypothetical protein NPX13_g10287 [Xylaria arbuscula]